MPCPAHSGLAASAGALRQAARAKINLDLRVIGRRPDGFHELVSLVAFASIGDVVSLTPAPEFSLTIDGPFAGALDGENLITKAALYAKLAATGKRWQSGAIHLTKNLPVAAGLGGGSADAAATLNLLGQANPQAAPHIDWHAIARRLGADVPVCLSSVAAHMTGIGERLTPVPDLPPAAILLANPRVPLATAEVFRALKAPAIDANTVLSSAPTFRDFDDLIAQLAASRNDLEAAARRLCPPIATVLAKLERLPGQRLVRMSGSGPTCFALFATLAEAEVAQALLNATAPELWSAAGLLQ